MRSNGYFSKNDLLQELRILLWAHLARLDRFLGGGIRVRGAGVLSPEDLDMEAYGITQTYQALYDYAMSGEWDCLGGLMPLGECVAEASDFARHAGVLEPQDLGGRRIAGHCAAISQTAAARWKLDQGTEDLTIGELAALAHLSEKSIRNSTSAEGHHRLTTYHLAGRTLIAREEALRWLGHRRGFAPTRVIDSIAAYSPERFDTLAELGRYVRGRRETLGLSEADLAARLGWAGNIRMPGSGLVALLEAGELRIGGDEALALAEALEIDGLWLSIRTLHLADQSPTSTEAITT